jgi:hypothetical protein
VDRSEVTRLVESRAARVIVVLLMAVPAFLAFNYIYRFGVDAVFWDEWVLVPLVDKLDRGTLSFSDLFAAHSEHRILFPQLLMLGIAEATHFNTLVTMYVSFALLCTIGGLLLREHLRTFGTSTAALALFIPSAWLVFTLRQAHNLVWAWQIQIVLQVVSLIGALYLLSSGGQHWWTLPVAIGLGVVSSLSFAAGMTVWPAGLVAIEMDSRSREGVTAKARWLRRVSWFAAAAAMTAVYWHGYVKPDRHPSPAFALENPGQGFFYFLASLGGALTDNADASAGLGALLLIVGVVVVFLAVVRQLELSRAAFGISLMAFAVASSIMLTVGRGGFGTPVATSSRYATMTVIGLVGAWRCVLAVKADQARRILMGFVLAIMGMGIFGSLNGALQVGFELRNARRRGAEALKHFRDAPDADLAVLNPGVPYIRTYAPVLERLQMNVFRRQSRTVP